MVHRYLEQKLKEAEETNDHLIAIVSASSRSQLQLQLPVPRPSLQSSLPSLPSLPPPPSWPVLSPLLPPVHTPQLPKRRLSLVIVGGHYSLNTYALLECRWISLAPLSEPRIGASAVRLGNTIYVTGGEDGLAMSVISLSLDAYINNDLKSVAAAGGATWKTETPMPMPMHNHNSFVHHGKIYCVAGKCIQCYEPVSKLWTILNKGTTAILAAGVASPDGKCYYLFGGRVDGSGDDDGSLSKQCQVYDIATNAWTPLPSLPRQRVGHCAYMTKRGTIVLIGGSDSSRLTKKYHGEIDEFNPRTRKWYKLPWKLPRGREKFAVSYDAECDTLTVAGGTNGQMLAATAVLHPDGTWKACLPLPVLLCNMAFC